MYLVFSLVFGVSVCLSTSYFNFLLIGIHNFLHFFVLSIINQHERFRTISWALPQTKILEPVKRNRRIGKPAQNHSFFASGIFWMTFSGLSRVRSPQILSSLRKCTRPQNLSWPNLKNQPIRKTCGQTSKISLFAHSRPVLLRFYVSPVKLAVCQWYLLGRDGHQLFAKFARSKIPDRWCTRKCKIDSDFNFKLLRLSFSLK